MDILVYFAHGLLVATYLVREMLALRLLNLGASGCLAVYFAALPDPLVTCAVANGTYAALNFVHAARLAAGRQVGPGAAAPGRRDGNNPGTRFPRFDILRIRARRKLSPYLQRT